jgi:hypothetical protein
MAPITAASRRPVVDFDETGFSLAPVNLCRSGIRVHANAISSEAELPDMLSAVDFRDGSSLKTVRVDLYVQ